MAGLEPARAFYGPTDFKSVASAISPHRLFARWSLSIFQIGRKRISWSPKLREACKEVLPFGPRNWKSINVGNRLELGLCRKCGRARANNLDC
jgi:hypothetical protein